MLLVPIKPQVAKPFYITCCVCQQTGEHMTMWADLEAERSKEYYHAECKPNCS